jgi:hypothetical protein
MIEESFRYYNTFSEHAVVFKEKNYRLNYFFSIVLFAFAFVFKLDLVCGKLFDKLLCRIKLSDDIVYFTFTLNQIIINEDIVRDVVKIKGYDFIKINRLFIIRYLILILAIIKESKSVFKALWNSHDLLHIFQNPRKFVELFGYRIIFENLLSECSTLIHYNDHSLKNTLLFDVAKAKGIKTIYIQHAPVSKRFPSLYNDLNVLFSLDSLNKYSNEFKKKVFVYFDSRFIKLKAIERSTLLNSVLICTNGLDSIEKVFDLVVFLNRYRINSVVRIHPGDKRNWSKYNFVMSYNKKISDDLLNFDFVICNESAVVLDSIFQNNFLYVCPFLGINEDFIDGYEYFKNGLLNKYFNSMPDLLDALNARICTYNSSNINFYIGDRNMENELNFKLKSEILYL